VRARFANFLPTTAEGRKEEGMSGAALINPSSPSGGKEKGKGGMNISSNRFPALQGEKEGENKKKRTGCLFSFPCPQKGRGGGGGFINISYILISGEKKKRQRKKGGRKKRKSI